MEHVLAVDAAHVLAVQGVTTVNFSGFASASYPDLGSGVQVSPKPCHKVYFAPYCCQILSQPAMEVPTVSWRDLCWGCHSGANRQHLAGALSAHPGSPC